MARTNPHKPFVPRAEQLALRPSVSGNAINGLGEEAPRRARMVYWSPDPDDIPHGRMQRWFYQADPDNVHVNAARQQRASLLTEEIGPLVGDPVARNPKDWLESLQRHAEREVPCERVGVTALDPDWLYEGVERDFANVIVIAVQHDTDEIAQAPHGRAGAEVIRQYGRAALSARRIATWLRGQGWEAEAVTGPMTGPLLLIPPAIACGFGELGKHGSLIDPEFGASFRLSAVMTDAPIAPTPQRDHGIDDFCASCRVCEQACPPEAIAPDKQIVRGQAKWYVDFDKCLPFFNQHHGCAICIAVCPWSLPGVGLNLADKLARRRARS
ncbi:MAG: 4Fe-4S dicluster domain-containing protein [Pseudomonadota bacterium]|nr:4Fe-4S dicluster domain-containing protein [Pseudomonadota bacterium]